MNLFQVTKKQPSGGLEIKTATGDIASFTTHYSEPLPPPFNGLNVKCTIEAQGGGGTPATPNPIVGHSELNLTRCGKNFVSDYKVNAGRSIYQDCLWLECELLPNTTYTLSLEGTNGNRFYTNGELFTNAIYKDISGRTFIEITTKSSISKSTPQQYANGYGWRVLKNAKNQDEDNTFANVQLELGSTATAYEPYHGTPYLVQFGQTVYGGELDVTTGVLTITHKRIDLGSLNWNTSWYTSDEPLGRIFANLTHKKPGLNNLNCEIYPLANTTDSYMSDVTITGNVSLGYIYIRDTNHATGADLVASLSGHYLVYELATPIEIDVSALSVDTIVGTNNVFADTGSVEVKYLDVV